MKIIRGFKASVALNATCFYINIYFISLFKQVFIFWFVVDTNFKFDWCSLCNVHVFLFPWRTWKTSRSWTSSAKMSLTPSRLKCRSIQTRRSRLLPCQVGLWSCHVPHYCHLWPGLQNEPHLGTFQDFVVVIFKFSIAEASKRSVVCWYLLIYRLETS